MSNDSSNLKSIRKPASLSGMKYALLGICATLFLFFSAELIGSLLISLIPASRHMSSQAANNWLNNSIGAQFLYSLLADGIMLVGVVAMLKFFRWNWSAIGMKTPSFRHIALGAITVVPYYVYLFIVVQILSALIPSLNVSQKQEIGFDNVNGGISLALAFVSLVIIPPLVEEIIMRGFLYSSLRKWLPKVVSALLVSALFGAAHLAEGGQSGPLWIGAIDTFTLSLFLVSLREITGSLWAGITLHAVKNGVAFLTIFLTKVH